MALIAQGVSIQGMTYFQRSLYMHRTRHYIANMIMRSGDTTHTIVTWIRPWNTKTAASKGQIGRQSGRPRHHISSVRITWTGTRIVKRKRHQEVGDKYLPASGHKRSKKSLAEDPLRGVRRYFKEDQPITERPYVASGQILGPRSSTIVQIKGIHTLSENPTGNRANS